MLGELQSVDGYMNIALEKTEEYVNGKLRHSYGDAFIRGNNGLFISRCARPLLILCPVASALHFRLVMELAIDPIYSTRRGTPLFSEELEP